MLVCQPPILALQIIVIDVFQDEESRYHFKKINYPIDIIMGTLFDIVNDFMIPGSRIRNRLS